MRADTAHEPLSAGENDRGRNQEWRDTHVIQARDGAGRIITVHRAEHLMAGESGLDSNFGGFGIANFANHDDIRVLPENRAQRIREGEADFFLGRHLVDAGNLEFDRVFDGDDVVSGIVEFVQRRIKSRSLAGTGRAGDKNQTVRRIDAVLNCAKVSASSPSLSMLADKLDLSSTRSTIFSPCTVGIIETRRS